MLPIRKKTVHELTMELSDNRIQLPNDCSMKRKKVSTSETVATLSDEKLVVLPSGEDLTNRAKELTEELSSVFEVADEQKISRHDGDEVSELSYSKEEEDERAVELMDAQDILFKREQDALGIEEDENMLKYSEGEEYERATEIIAERDYLFKSEQDVSEPEDDVDTLKYSEVEECERAAELSGAMEQIFVQDTLKYPALRL